MKHQKKNTEKLQTFQIIKEIIRDDRKNKNISQKLINNFDNK